MLRMNNTDKARKNSLRAARLIPLSNITWIENYGGFDIYFNEYANKYVVELGGKRHQIKRILNIRNKITNFNNEK